jgi:predicted AlkP superfamily phosphohydrolase/phosphomutase
MKRGHGVLYLALDACDAATAQRLATEGRMPTLQHLLIDSAHIETVAPPGVYASAIWPTFFTGLDPAHHGYFCWKQFSPGTYDDVSTTPDLIAGRPLWERVSDAGGRVAVVDVPHTRAPDALNGLMLVEWGCHDRHFGTHSYPVGLVDELNERFGAHPVGTRPQPAPGWDNFAPSDYAHRAGLHRTVDEQAALWDDLLEGQERKRRVSLDLLDRGPWDLFVSVLAEAHCTGHQLWSVHDTTHPWHDPATRDRIGDPIAEMYARLDASVADHLQRSAPGTTVYVHLSHGMGPRYDGTHLLDDILRRLAVPPHAGARQVVRGTASATIGQLARRRPGGWTAAALRKRHARCGEPPDLGPDPEPVGGDRATRPWFAIPNNMVCGAVRLNVIGREPSGVLAPGAAIDAACDRLARWLREVVNADTGEPLVTEVMRTESVYERRHGDALPDLLVEWNRRTPVERVWSPRIGLVERAATHWRTGDHTDRGLLLARGPGIEPGPRGATGVVDVGTTIAAAAGVTLDDVDGRPVPSLVPRPDGAGRTGWDAGHALASGAPERQGLGSGR